MCNGSLVEPPNSINEGVAVRKPNVRHIATHEAASLRSLGSAHLARAAARTAHTSRTNEEGVENAADVFSRIDTSKESDNKPHK